GHPDDNEWLKVSTDRIPVFSADSGLMTTTSPSPAAREQNSKGGVSNKVIADAKLHIHKLQQLAGHESLQVADAMTKLADLYCRREELDEMEPLLIEALRMREKICGENHLSVSTDLKNLGRLYYFKQKYDQAEALLQKARVIREGALGPTHSYVADVAEWQARIMRKTHRVDEALKLEKFVSDCREQKTFQTGNNSKPWAANCRKPANCWKLKPCGWLHWTSVLSFASMIPGSASPWKI
ncbi:MAG TPA: tetratricopeptide repeat protein, partial [Candidatus Obscuribacter sp.]|nr:tetratricopeptide repeat protein [Candidatus Obscuribacter sp.]